MHRKKCSTRPPQQLFASAVQDMQNTRSRITQPRATESSTRFKVFIMCRNIKTLFNFQPSVTPDEARAAALQYVRKISGFNKPSRANEAAFLSAVDEVAAASLRLLGSLETSAPPKDREQEAAKARARGATRFGA